MRARVAGRQAVALRTLWQLNAGGLSFRCVLSAEEPGLYHVESRTPEGWGEFTRFKASHDRVAHALLVRLVGSKTVAEALASVTRSLREGGVVPRPGTP